MQIFSSFEELLASLAEDQITSEDAETFLLADRLAAQTLINETSSRRAIETLIAAAIIVHTISAKPGHSLERSQQVFERILLVGSSIAINGLANANAAGETPLAGGQLVSGLDRLLSGSIMRANGYPKNSFNPEELSAWATREFAPKLARLGAILRAEQQAEQTQPGEATAH